MTREMFENLPYLAVSNDGNKVIWSYMQELYLYDFELNKKSKILDEKNNNVFFERVAFTEDCKNIIFMGSMADQEDELCYGLLELDSGKITSRSKLNREQYEEAAKKCYQRIKNNAVFNLLYNQYYYAKEDPTQRYIMDPRGWNTLLCKNKIDFILILCLIIIFTPVFCDEYENDMDLLMLSSSRGRYKAGIAKLFIGFTLAALLCALFCAIEFYCIDYMVGLDNGGFPLQSLEFFKGSEYHISIYNAFLLVILTRILGCILLTEFIFILSILSKKTIITLIIGDHIKYKSLIDNKWELYYQLNG